MKAHWVLCAVLAAATGCDHDLYTIRMTPRDGGMDRSLEVTHVTGPQKKDAALVPLSQEEVQRLSNLYSTTKSGRSSVTFSGMFGERLPGDLGDRRGWYTEFAAPMGSLRVYTESIRGDDDLAGGIEKNFKGIDRSVDLQIGFAKAQFGKDPAYGRLEQFLDREFRKDLKNLLMQAWLASAQDNHIEDGQNRRPAPEIETAARAAQYLMDRGYFKPKDVPPFVKGLTGTDDEKNAAFKVFWRAFVLNKLALPDSPIRKWLLAMPDHSEQVQKTFEEYVSKLPEYRQAVERAKKEKKAATGPTPQEWLSSDFGDLPADFFHCLIPVFLGKDDAIEIELACDSPPLATNGHWDAAGKKVTWTLREDKKPTVPLQPFAIWAQADEKFQKRHFGKMVLEEQGLAMFCFWREGLWPLQRKEMDEFLSKQVPGKEQIDQLRNFRFSEAALAPVPPATQPTSQAEDQPVEGIKLILNGLEAK